MIRESFVVQMTPFIIDDQALSYTQIKSMYSLNHADCPKLSTGIIPATKMHYFIFGSKKFHIYLALGSIFSTNSSDWSLQNTEVSCDWPVCTPEV
jgi:hypothetical protein